MTRVETVSQEIVVGVGMPTFNREVYLRRALDSFLAQTYKNIIIVICDNNSSDGTQKLCEEYVKRDRRIRYIRHKKNISRDANATFALQQIVSVADLCLMTSDDDLAEPQFIEKCVEALNADPDAGMAITNHDTIYYGTDKILPKELALHVPDKKDLYARLKQFILFYSHDERSFCMSGVFRRGIVEGERFEDRMESDVGFALRCLSRAYFLPASDEILFHKGVISGIGKESLREIPLSFRKVRLAIISRFLRTGSEFHNIRFLLSVSRLSLWQKVKLIFWNLIVVVRLFTRVKV